MFQLHIQVSPLQLINSLLLTILTPQSPNFLGFFASINKNLKRGYVYKTSYVNSILS